MKKLLSSIFLIFSSIFIGFSQSHYSTQAHQSSISDLKAVFSKNSTTKEYFSAGEDGFLIKWSEDNQGEHFQITELTIKMIAVSPNGNEIAVYETDGGLTNRVSVWDWNKLTRKFARRFEDSITSINFSANGTYLIVGTTSIKGSVFINAENGSVVNKVKDDTGIISYTITSPTEKSCAMYSPTKGTLSYYNLYSGRESKFLYVEPELSNPVLFNNFMYLAGVKNNEIYIINAVTGKTISKIQSQNPIPLSSQYDSDFYFLENDGRGTYALKFAQNIDNKSLTSPQIIKNMKGPRGREIISSGIKNKSEILLGSKSGDLFKIDTNAQTEVQILSPITENFYDKILDMSPYNDDFYFLAKNSLFISSYDTGTVNGVGKNPGQTDLITYEDKVILWSKGTKNPIQLYDYKKPELKTLFTPQNNTQIVKVFGNLILEMENNSIVNTYNIDSGKFTEVYTGSGLQDAVIASNGKLYIAKSYDTTPKSPLLMVDLQTKETVPTKLPGNVSFALNTELEKSLIYGINVYESAESKRTCIFKYNIQNDSTTTILSFKDEDTDAFTYLKYPTLYTNIGKSRVRSINLSQNRSITLNRSSSMPRKVCKNSRRVAVLNRDGSVSWYDDNLSQVLADWYLTKDGQWYEF